MKQLTKEQAIEFAESRIWENWTDHQIVNFQLFQDLLCIDFTRFHEAIEKVLHRPVYTHEFAKQQSLQKEFLKEKPAPTLEEIINLIPEEKRIIIGI
jgi:hypothetical protein